MLEKSSNSCRLRGYSSWITLFVLVLVLPILLYSGYCQGLWGRNILLLQYLFQCKCPVSSEERRYPQEADVIMSACRSVSVMLSPGGSRLYVVESPSTSSDSYLLNLQTLEQVPIQTKESYFLFLNDDILFHQNGEYILDGLTGRQYPIQSFRQLRPDAYSNGVLNPYLLVEALWQADKVFVLDNGVYTLVALSSDFRIHPENSFVIHSFEIRDLETFLKQNNITYYKAPPTSFWDSFPGEVLSPDRRFIARNDGVYLAKNNQKIVAGVPHLLVRGWINYGRVLYSSNHLDPCLFEFGIPMLDDGPSCWIVVPEPVISLKVPDEYLLSASP